MAQLVFERNGFFHHVVFDATTEEVSSYSSAITQHPVERGISIADHVRPNPLKLNISGLITETPIYETRMQYTAEGALREARVTRAAVYGGPTLMNQGMTILTGYDAHQTRTAQVSGGQVGPQVNGIGKAHNPPSASAGEWRTDEFGVQARVLTAVNDTERVRRSYEQLVVLLDQKFKLTVITALHVYPNMVMTSLTAPREPTASMVFGMEFSEFFEAEVRTGLVPRTRKTAIKKAQPKAAEGPKPKGWKLPSPTEVLNSLVSRGLDGLLGLNR